MEITFRSNMRVLAVQSQKSLEPQNNHLEAEWLMEWSLSNDFTKITFPVRKSLGKNVLTLFSLVICSLHQMLSWTLRTSL